MNPSLEDVSRYAAKFGKRGIAELQILNEMVPYLEAVTLNSPGKEILMEDAERCIALMRKGYKEELTADDRIELRYLKARLDKISNRLNDFHDRQNKIIDGMKQSGN